MVFCLSWKMHGGDVWGASCMLFGYYIPSILCTFNNDVRFRSYAVARICVFVLPTLTSFTQLYQGIWVAWHNWIHVLWHIVHFILHPKQFWKSGRSSTKRWHGLPTKSPLLYIALIWLGIYMIGWQNLVFLPFIHIIVHPQWFWKSGIIWSRRWCQLPLLKHCIRSKLNINDWTSEKCFPISNTLYITIQKCLMDCKGVYGKVATCYLPPSHLLDFLLLSIAYNTILRLNKYWPMHSAS